MPKCTHVIAALLLASSSTALMAAGGGGGGGGGFSSPSESAPRYDPAEEYRKGIAALQAKDFKAAKISFDRVTSAAPKDANSQYLAGLARQGLNDWKGARKSFERAAKLDPSLVRAWRELGVSSAKMGDAAKAGEVVAGLKAKAATCGPTCPQATELAEATKAVEAALAGRPTVSVAPSHSLLFASADRGDAFYLTAVSLINERRYEDAIASLKTAQGAFGPHPDILTYLGFANRKLGRFDEAETYYRAALSAAPQHRGATEYYGELMVERGDLAGARAKLAELDKQCRFGCYEAEELRRWITAGRSPHSS
jgi:tetratricopeptide (TPR) repeat protein